MKKNILAILLLAVSLCIVITYKQIDSANTDSMPPILTAESDTITASVTVSEEELIKGVKAFDTKYGDVTDTIVVEDISNFIGENTRIITYAAVDGSMNVGRLERTLVYTDYKEPSFNLTKPLSFIVGTRIDILANITADSILDSDLTSKIRYGLDSVIDNLQVGEYPVEFRVTDSCGKTSYFKTHIEIYDSSYSAIDVELKEYLIYLPVNAKFSASDYYKTSSLDGELDITYYKTTDDGKLTTTNKVDTKTPGTYYVDYLVSTPNIQGKSRLVVVVE